MPDSSDPDARAFREIHPDQLPLAFGAFLDAHRGCPGEAVELRRSGSLAVAYCAQCDDIRTFVLTEDI